jgi:hypothetical protein
LRDDVQDIWPEKRFTPCQANPRASNMGESRGDLTDFPGGELALQRLPTNTFFGEAIDTAHIAAIRD